MAYLAQLGKVKEEAKVIFDQWIQDLKFKSWLDSNLDR